MNEETSRTQRRPDREFAGHELPDGWLRPQPNNQATLFPGPTDEVLAALGVSRGDVRKWRDLGWISFDIDAMERLDEPDEWELTFVRNLAQSPLSIRQIEELLAGLPRPLRYDPVKTVFHFKYGWVAPYQEDPFEVVDREVEDWIENLREEGDTARLLELAELTHQVISRDDSEESEEIGESS